MSAEGRLEPATAGAGGDVAAWETRQLSGEGREIHFLLPPSAAAPFQVPSCTGNVFTIDPLSWKRGDQRISCHLG